MQYHCSLDRSIAFIFNTCNSFVELQVYTSADHGQCRFISINPVPLLASNYYRFIIPWASNKCSPGNPVSDNFMFAIELSDNTKCISVSNFKMLTTDNVEMISLFRFEQTIIAGILFLRASTKVLEGTFANDNLYYRVVW